MWRRVVLLVLLPFWLGGCLELFTHQTTPVSGTDTRTEDIHTPHLFGVGFDISE